MTDTNILQRVSQGKAMLHVRALRQRGVRLATTDRNAFELRRNLVGKLGLSEEEAAVELERVLAPFELILSDDYDYLQTAADVRLREGGKSDWPALAAALAFDGQIWSEDVDFFGVGVPVWTTNNVRFAQAEEND
ncbi:PIN domain-containing protein [Sphingomonas sp.]|uniref:PIN domain-containing protein n=1 Tax=Sphingomonas sp. TaxID=28214 RepID=UPI0035BBDA38